MFDMFKKIFQSDQGKDREKILAPVEGSVIPLSEVNDPAFSEELLGKGVAIVPTRGRIVAPAGGEVTVMFETKHAVSVTTDTGAQIIVHVGLDTVNLNGEHFVSHVAQGDRVNAGDLMLEFDILAIKEAGYEVVTPVIVCNTPDYPDMVCHIGLDVKELDPVIEL